MKQFLSVSKQISKEILNTNSNLQTHKTLQYQTLFFKSDRYKKVRTLSSVKNQVRPDTQKQQQKQQQPQNQSIQPQQNDPQQNHHQKENQNKVHLTGPNKLIRWIKEGRTSVIPFYVKNILNKTNPSLKMTKFQEQDLNAQKGQKIKEQTTKVQKEKQQSSQNPIDENLSERKERPRVITSSQYRRDLMKNYRVIQALKASNRIYLYQSKRSFSQKFFKHFNQNKTQMTAVAVSLAFFTSILILKKLFFSDQNAKQVTFQKTQGQNKSKQVINLQDHQIFNKLSSIQSITFKELSTNSVRKHMMEIRYKSNQQKSSLQLLAAKISSLLSLQHSFDKIQRFYTVQNPNSLLSGLEHVQENLPKQSWVQIMIKPKYYNAFTAVKDTLLLMTPFIGAGITYWIFRKMNPDTLLSGMTSGKKSMRVQSTKDIKVRFKDVAGMESAKKQITQFVDFLKKSDKYIEMGAKIPKGALLTGPPGTGKTMLAKACAGQASTSFFYVSGSEFVQMFVGLGASRVRQLFAKARQEAPSIIFIDQIDAIGKKRQTSRNQQKDSTLNQLLVQMDGFSSNQTVIVLAATNRKDVLDSALTRPGRFDRMVEVTLPDIKARQQIFMVHLGPLKINPQKNLNDIAKRLSELTPGFSGADIANLCNQAAIIATRKQRNYIQDADFQEASERIVAGYIKKGNSTPKTKKRVAFHEAGHAVCGWYLKGGDPLVKLTIIPRSKGALGYAQYLPKNSYIKSKSQLIDQVAIMLGGTTSQQLFFGDMSSGASDDLQKVYQLTRRMVTQFGMGSQTYNVTLDEQRYVKKQSQKLCNLMDDQIMEIVQQASKRAKEILLQKKQIVQKLSTQLLQKQTINNEDIIRIMGVRPAFS